MHAMGEIRPQNRFMVQPRLDDGWEVVDRVNGSRSERFDTYDAADKEATQRNSPK